MSSIPRNAENENNVLDFVTNFIAEFHIGKLLLKCNTGKEKGIPVMDIFHYLLRVKSSLVYFYNFLAFGFFYYMNSIVEKANFFS